MQKIRCLPFLRRFKEKGLPPPGCETPAFQGQRLCCPVPVEVRRFRFLLPCHPVRRNIRSLRRGFRLRSRFLCRCALPDRNRCLLSRRGFCGGFRRISGNPAAAGQQEYKGGRRCRGGRQTGGPAPAGPRFILPGSYVSGILTYCKRQIHPSSSPSRIPVRSTHSCRRAGY